MTLDWLFPWRRPTKAMKPFEPVAAMQDVRVASDAHTQVTSRAQTIALHEIDRQVARSMLESVFARGEQIRAMANETIDRTRT